MRPQLDYLNIYMGKFFGLTELREQRWGDGERSSIIRLFGRAKGIK